VEQLLTYLARALVDQPDQVSLRMSEVDGARLFELKVAPEDVGKVIGRDGRTVNALRTLLNAAAQKSGQKVRLEILDDRRNATGAAPAPDASR
jgi:predicted RNA-binding protein YlqC (UPF0109 family)